MSVFMGSYVHIFITLLSLSGVFFIPSVWGSDTGAAQITLYANKQTCLVFHAFLGIKLFKKNEYTDVLSKAKLIH